MRENGVKGQKIGILCVLGAVMLYFFSIVWVNLNAGQWYNYDIYADAMVAKYMAEYNTLFPENWTFGNQFYVMATPVVASLIYRICGSTVLAMGIASCLMTVMTLWCFWWCIRSFARRESILVGILCLIGGTMFEKNAASDAAGLQVFYTMCSYYACYLIGILVTVGVWLRFEKGYKVSHAVVALCLLMNAALGMQSLREMLVLNVPLCLLVFVGSLVKKTWKTKANMFAAGALIANAAGVLLSNVLVKLMDVKQMTILKKPDGGMRERIVSNIRSLLDCMGYPIVWDGGILTVIRLFGFAVVVGIVIAAFIYAAKNKMSGALPTMILFCCASLAGVFCAGVTVISTRAIYYFVWHLLVAFSFMYLMEMDSVRQWSKMCLIAGLIAISAVNYAGQFGYVIRDYVQVRSRYEDIAQYLTENDVTHVFYDESAIFGAPRIAALADDQVVFGAVWFRNADAANGDMIDAIPYLCADEWFAPGETDKAYLLLSENSTKSLKEYQEEFESMLMPEQQFRVGSETYFFYSFENEVLRDIQTQ